MKLYVLVRKDIPANVQAVQGGHAVAEFLLKCAQSWGNDTLVYLGVKNERQLKLWRHKFTSLNIKYASWREPDMNNEMTAIATMASGELLKNLNTL